MRLSSLPLVPVAAGVLVRRRAPDHRRRGAAGQPHPGRRQHPGGPARRDPLALNRNTAYRNTRTGFDVDSSHSTLTGNLAVGNAAAVSLGASSTGSGNSWNVASTWSDADLTSVDPALITGPRAADGTIATSAFLRPRAHPELGAQI